MNQVGQQAVDAPVVVLTRSAATMRGALIVVTFCVAQATIGVLAWAAKSGVLIFVGEVAIGVLFTTAADRLAAKAKPPAPPREPSSTTTDLRLPVEPAKSIRALQTHCRWCGRILTDMDSRLNGAGSTCLRRYGARPLYISNPAHVHWQEETRRARITIQAEQELLDRDLLRLQNEWAAQVRHYEQALVDTAPARLRYERIGRLADRVAWFAFAFAVALVVGWLIDTEATIASAP